MALNNLFQDELINRRSIAKTPVNTTSKSTSALPNIFALPSYAPVSAKPVSTNITQVTTPRQIASIASDISPAATSNVSVPQPTKTYYKNGESITLTPQQAAMQGGEAGLSASGWTTNITPTPEPAPTPSQDFNINYSGVADTSQLGTKVSGVDLNEIIKQNQALQEKYLSALEPTTEETSLQQQIADLASQQEQLRLSAQQGIQQIGQKTIPMQFITGQQQNVQQQYELGQQTLTGQIENLTNRLGIEQAKRQSTTEKLKALLGFGKESQDLQFKIQESLQKQQSDYLSAIKDLEADARSNLSLILDKFKGLDYNELDTQTQGQLAQLAANAGIPVGVVISGLEVAKNEILTKDLLSVAEAEKLGVPYGTTTAQAAQMGIKPGEATQASELKQGALTSAQQLLQKFISGEGTSAVGASRILGIQKIPGTAAKNFEIQFNNLKAQLSLDAVKYLKGQGQVTENERKMLSDAVAKLDLSQSEAEFKKSLNEIITALSGGQDDPLGLGFNQLPSKSVNGSLDKIVQSIGQFESGGNYKAVGPATSTGDKAYGKYQVMGSNIPAWTKEALGKSLTIQQYLNNPQAQDSVAKYKMGQYYQKYGTLEDVATAWFAGPGAVGKNSQAKDVLGTSVPQYIKNVQAIYNRLS